MLKPLNDYIYLGSVPADESISSIPNRRIFQMRVLIEQIRRIVGPEPKGAFLTIQSFYTGGGYSEVVCQYDSENQEGREYALRTEHEFPGSWDLIARVQLTAGRMPMDNDSAWVNNY